MHSGQRVATHTTCQTLSQSCPSLPSRGGAYETVTRYTRSRHLAQNRYMLYEAVACLWSLSWFHRQNRYTRKPLHTKTGTHQNNTPQPLHARNNLEGHAHTADVKRLNTPSSNHVHTPVSKHMLAQSCPSQPSRSPLLLELTEVPLLL